MAAHIPAFRMWLPWNETVSTVYCVHFIPSKHENDIVWISLKGTLNTSIVEERAQCAPRNQDMVNTERVMYRVATGKFHSCDGSVRGQSPIKAKVQH